MIPVEQRNCRNCRHCLPSRFHPSEDTCLKYGGENCADILGHPGCFPDGCKPNDLKHWTPKPLNIFQKYWKWLNDD